MIFINGALNSSTTPVNDDFVFTVDTGTSKSFHISKGNLTNSEAKFIVDKGDGNQVIIDGISDANFDLIYADDGIYEIRIKKNDPGATYRINLYDDDEDIDKIISVKQFGFSILQTFWGAVELVSINDIPTLPDQTDVSNILRECKKLTHIKNLESWVDWSLVINGNNAFNMLESYNEPILIDDLSSLENGSGMFTRMLMYNHEFLFTDLSSLQTGQNMFRNLEAYEYDLEFITSSDLTNLNWFITSSGLIGKLSLSDCSGVTSATDIVFGCEYIEELILTDFALDIDVSGCYIVTETNHLLLINSLADLTSKPSRQLTHTSTGWTPACASLLSSKNWTD